MTGHRATPRASRPPVWAGAAVALCLVMPVLAQAPSALVVRAGRVIVGNGKVLAPGAVLLRDGKIAAVGGTVDAPEGARVLDLPEAVVIPGLVAAHTTLAEGTRDTERSLTPDLSSSESFDTMADWRPLLEGGVTTVYLSPPSGRIVPGRGAVARLGIGSPSGAIVAGEGPLRVVLGETPKNPPVLWDPPLPPTADHPTSPPVRQLPTTRAGELALLGRLFAGQVEESASPAVQAAREGKLTVRVQADRLEDIRNAVALADAYGLRLVLEGATESYRVADELARRGIPVVLIPSLHARTREETDLSGVRGEERPDTAAVLSRAGVHVAISTEPASLRHLLGYGAWLVGQGLTPEDALRSLTSGAAEILGVGGAVGTLESGKEGDLVVLSGEPFASTTRVLATVAGGVVAYDATDAVASPEAVPTLILRAATIHTGAGGAISGGEVRIRDGTILSVGPRGATPPGVEVVDLGDRVLMPGMVDMHSHLGLHWESDDPTLNPGSVLTDPSGAARAVSIAAALDPTDPAFVEAARAGVTCVAVAPGTSGEFCGAVAAVKTAGGSWEQRLVAPVVALKFSMGDLGTAMRAAWSMRELLGRAKQYDAAWEAFDARWAEYERRCAADPEAEPAVPDRPGRDSQLELLRGLFRDGAPAIVAADHAPVMRQAIEVFRQEYGLNLVLLGARDSFRLAPELREAQVGCALGSEVLYREKGRETCIPAAAASAGVPVAFPSGSSTGSLYLRATAAEAMRNGLPHADALRALTATPARLLGLGHRLGSLETGRDADLVVLTGDPLELTSRVVRTYIDGRVVFDAEASQ